MSQSSWLVAGMVPGVERLPLKKLKADEGTFLKLLIDGRIVLPRSDRPQGQIVGLERRTSAVGRDTISHPERGHDDLANAVAGAAALCKFGGYDTSMRWVSDDDTDSGSAWERVRFQAFINSGGHIRL
jgi:hypothetical protein